MILLNYDISYNYERSLVDLTNKELMGKMNIFPFECRQC